MRLAFISGPYRADTVRGIVDNIRAAESVAIEYWKNGYAVICPHTNTALMDGILPDQSWLDGCLEMVRRCDVVVMCDGWRNSSGARAELDLATRLGKEVHYRHVTSSSISCLQIPVVVKK